MADNLRAAEEAVDRGPGVRDERLVDHNARARDAEERGDRDAHRGDPREHDRSEGGNVGESPEAASECRGEGESNERKEEEQRRV